MKVPARIVGRWQLLTAVSIAAVSLLFSFRQQKGTGAIDGQWMVSDRECLAECNFPAVAARVTEICVCRGKVIMQVGGRYYEGPITFKADQYYANIGPMVFGDILHRAYLVNAGVGLFG